jgi:hypothetical protein
MGASSRVPYTVSTPAGRRTAFSATAFQLDVLSPAGAPPAYHRDYVRVAAWLFAFLLGPLLAALIVLLVT